MDSEMEVLCFAILILEGLLDLVSSIFIIVSLSLDGLQKKTLAPLNRILISLNVSNVFLAVFTSVFLFTSTLCPYLYNVTSTFFFFSYMALSSINSSSWLTAALCFFYFIKISPSGFLVNIKNKIDCLTWRLIFVVETISLGGSFLALLTLAENTKNSTMSSAETEEEYRSQKLKLMSVILFLNSLPFTIIISTIVASACFLRVYDRRMKTSNGSLVNSNVKDYRGAVQTMIGLLIFYLLSIISVIISTLDIFAVNSAGYYICAMLLLSFPADQSMFFIYSNSRLMQILKELFRSLTCKA